MTTRIKENQVKGVIILVVIILLMMQVFISPAQSFQDGHEPYRGFMVSFGTRVASISSDIAAIDQTSVMGAGGQVGVIFGNSILRSRIGLLGYYSSTGNTAGTTDLYSSDASVNFYPLSLLCGRKPLVEPYLTGGISYDRFKFFGYYINREPGITNYSQAEAPYLGTIRQVNATAGLGIEIKLVDDHHFIHLFTEARLESTMSNKATHPVFEQTSLVDKMHLSVGVSFGAH